MIYQFKMNLKNVGVPVWRRLLIDSEMTFNDLHYIMLAAFDWTGGHLHEFEIRKSAGENFSDLEVRIGSASDEDAFFDHPFLSLAGIGRENFDETEEKLSDWFKQEKDRAFYTYDFGDDWEHVIVLEKILDADPEIEYPVCIKAKNDAPPEDSRGELLDGMIDLENPNAKEIIEDVNFMLEGDDFRERFIDFEPDEFF